MYVFFFLKKVLLTSVFHHTHDLLRGKFIVSRFLYQAKGIGPLETGKGTDTNNSPLPSASSASWEGQIKNPTYPRKFWGGAAG